MKNTDTAGHSLAEAIKSAGHKLYDKRINRDDMYQIRANVSEWIANPNVQVIISTGGTGVTGRDGTPEAIQVLLDKEVEGFGELFRQISYEEIGTSALQSRCLGGIANGTYIFSLPGSQNACATAWHKILEPQLDNRTKPCNFAMLITRLQES